MKTARFLTLATLLLLSVSCEKEEDLLIASADIPDWLYEQIQEDKKIIEADPKRMQNFGAWIRYEFNHAYYFEYDNPLSSLSRNPYSQAGIRIDVTQAPYIHYWSDKCCEQYVWKAPKYLALE